MNALDANRFADEWQAAWNAHDVERVLAHFAPDVVWTSPTAAQLIPGSDGVVKGISALRSYFDRGVAPGSDLRFEVVAVYLGVRSIVVNYRNQRGILVNEVMIFDPEGRVIEGHAAYLDASDAG